MSGYRLSADWSRTGSFAGTLEDLTSFADHDVDIVASWGRSEPRPTDDAADGSMTFALVNTGRQFSPENTSSPIYGKVLPGTRTSLDVTSPLDGSITTVFRGPIDSFDVDTSHPDRTFSATATAGWGIPGDSRLSTAVYQGVRTGDAVNIVLDQIGWPATARSVDPGATLIPYWWAEGVDANTAIADLVHSEGPPSIAYVLNGVFYFRDRHHRVLSARSVNSQGWFTHLIPVGDPVLAASDAFGRTVAAGDWGAADTGQSWTETSGASDFSVSSGVGNISLPAVSSERVATLPVVIPDVQLLATFTTSVVAAGASVNAYLLARRADGSNQYLGRVAFDPSGVIFVGLEKFVAGSVSGMGPLVSTGITYTAGVGYRMRMQVTGTTVRARVWAAAGGEPATWQVSQTDTDLTSAGTSVGVRAILSGGNTNTLPVTVTVDDLQVIPPDHKILEESFGYNHGLFNIVNSATLEVAPRLPGDREIVWSSDDPIVMSPGQVVTIVIRADDPFLDLQLPNNTDVYLTGPGGQFVSDYTLASGSVTPALSRTSGQAALLTLTAGGSGAVLDTGIRLRGTPLKAGSARQFSAQNLASAATYGDNNWGGSAPWAYFYDAQTICDRIVGVYSEPQPTVTLDVEGVISQQTLARELATALSDRVTVRNDEMRLNADFIIEKITHTVRRLGGRHIMTIAASVVEPLQAAQPFVFDTATPTVNGFGNGRFSADGANNPATMFRFDTATPATNGFGSGVFAA